MAISTTKFTITSAAYVAVAAGVGTVHIQPLTTGTLRLIGATALPAPGATDFQPIHGAKEFASLSPEADIIYLRAEGEDVQVVVHAY
ncbi:hypothetical protein [Celeribacter naphthalenivorans]|uniref:hypothetical protein n=1 Tax=Celeribacter naphthalenivorans TaxID=1614694 RepID=UPI001CFAEA43|nr:hypothetical protein [Celeribacter naphthalenivorans]